MRGIVRYSPHTPAATDAVLIHEHARFQVKSTHEISQSAIHIAYNSGKKNFKDTRRDGFEGKLHTQGERL